MSEKMLRMKNTLEILDNYLERAISDKLNIVEVLDYIFNEEAKSKRKRAYEKQVQMSGFPIKKGLENFDFSFQPSIDKKQIYRLEKHFQFWAKRSLSLAFARHGKRVQNF